MDVNNFRKQKDFEYSVSEVMTSMTETLNFAARPINGQHLFPGVSLRSLGLAVREGFAFTTSYERRRD